MAEKGFGVKEVNLIGASGTPTITSPNNLNLNAVNVAISTNATVGGTLSVTGNVSVGGTLTYEDVTNIDAVGVITARAGIDCNADLDVDGRSELDNVNIAETLKVAGITTLSETLKFDVNVSSVPSASGNVHIYRHDNQLQLCGGSGIRFHEGGFSRWWIYGGALYPHGTTYNNLGTSSNRVGLSLIHI